MDVRARFRLPSQDYDERTCIIVVNVDDQSTGLIVDRVSEVADIPSANVEPAPGSGKGKIDSYIMGLGKVGDRVKILLDARRLLAI
jgi:purine-binding chemotaxis protein CheW